MSRYTEQEREQIMREAREHLAAVDLPPRDPADVLLANIRAEQSAQCAPPIEPEVEPSPRLVVTRALDDGLLEALVAEVHEALDEHKTFVSAQLAEIIAEIIHGSTEYIGKQTKMLDDKLSAELTIVRTEVERLRGEVALARAELERRSAATEFDTSGNNGFAIKH